MSDSELLKIASLACGSHPTPTLLAAVEELARRGVPLLPGVSPRPAERPSAIETSGTVDTAVRYGGFWRRFGAYWLDLLFFMPVVVLSLYLSGTTRYFYALALLPSLLTGLWYHVYLVKQFGGTPGKLVLGLRIRRIDGEPVGYREAILRGLVGEVLSIAISIAFSVAALRMSDTEYRSMTYLARAQQLMAQAPAWYRPINALNQLWAWGEFIVMLTNRKRRALHDFLAGTVVLHDPRHGAPAPPLPPP
jgi:uncharacterized RDD family membrane protein YckC